MYFSLLFMILFQYVESCFYAPVIEIFKKKKQFLNLISILNEMPCILLENDHKRWKSNGSHQRKYSRILQWRFWITTYIMNNVALLKAAYQWGCFCWIAVLSVYLLTQEFLWKSCHAYNKDFWILVFDELTHLHI